MIERCCSTRIGREAAGDRPATASGRSGPGRRIRAGGGLGHDLLDRVTPSDHSEWVWQVAAVVELDRCGSWPGERRLDLAFVLAQLGLDVREVEEGVGLLLGRERAQLGRVAGERLAGLQVDAQVALSDRLQPRSRRRAESTLCSFEPVKWIR